MANYGANTSNPKTYKSYANSQMAIADDSYKKGKDAMSGLVYLFRS